MEGVNVLKEVRGLRELRGLGLLGEVRGLGVTQVHSVGLGYSWAQLDWVGRAGVF